VTDTPDEPLWPASDDPAGRQPGESGSEWAHRQFAMLRQVLADHQPPGRAK
jgi:hypothetical protein